MTRIVLAPLIATCLILSSPSLPALADAAPPQPPPGTSLEPGESLTMVQMVWEEVLVTVGDDTASVQAIFKFRNQGTQTESFDVRFPLGAGDGYCDFQTIEQFDAWVDGAAAEIEVYDEPSGSWCGETGLPVPWAHWAVAFPPAQTVEIGVSYTLRPFHNRDGPWGYYLYILETGAGWYGPIGEGTVTVRLPYDVNEYNVRFNEYYPMPHSYSVSGTDIIWTFMDLEPTGDNNVEAVVMTPSVWREYIAARDQVEANPDSVDAHLRLTRVISEIVIGRHGDADQSPRGLELENQALASYQRALELAPSNVDIYIAYLDFLIAMWFPYGGGTPPAELLPTLDAALAIDPHNARLLEIRSFVYSFDLTPVPSPMPSPSLTPLATATLASDVDPLAPTRSVQNTLTPAPSHAVIPTLSASGLTPTITPTPPPGGGAGARLGIIAMGVLVVLMIGGAMVWLRSRRA